MSGRPQLVIFIFIAVTCLLIVGVARYFAAVEREALTVGIAESYATALNEMHDYYSSVVSERAERAGIKFSHDLKRDKDALPFPATFVNALGARLEATVTGLSARLYSEYPFPWAKDLRLSASQHAALTYLRQNRDKSFVYRTWVGGTEVLHLARALVMTQSCVDCHNRFDFDAGAKWAVGDFRGAREVSLPMVSGPSSDPRAYALAFALILLASALGALLVWPTVTRLNKALALSETLSRKLEYSATHDYLTGLPSLSLGRDRLEHAIALARRADTKAGVMFVDLDGFKTVNDSLGHDAGDQVLRVAAQRLSEALRETDTVARVGGDEFIVVLGTLTEPALASQAAARVVERLRQPISVAGRTVEIGSSIGIALFPDDGNDAESLLKLSDDAMYQVKKAGKNNFMAWRNGDRDGGP
jgi:diguanylate cyclase (GGDEF)-like protein